MARILVVDDEQSIRSMVAQILVDEGHEVVQAASAEEALQAFRDDSFALVITDVRMGGMDGFGLLNEVKRLSQEAHVVIMTAYASMDSAITALKAGAYDYITKPFEDLRLIANVARRAIQSFTLLKERKSLVENLKNSNKELENLSRRFKKLAVQDGLTELFNHRYFHEILAHEVARAMRYGGNLSVIFLDVDFFKKYNDRFGHQQGDRVLKKISWILRNNIRRADVPARYGGEEFVVILPETSKEDAYTVAEKIRKAVADSPVDFVKGQATTRITISAGVASLGQGSASASELIAKADQAVYQAKKAGRNTVCLAS